MSECVVRMELRDNCLDCDLHQTMYGDTREDTEVFCAKERRYIGRRFGPTKDLARPDWCPIVCSLPDNHGRLGDLDALPEFDKGGEYTAFYFIEAIENAPTIVPATERREA